jgi:threonine dehydrogenase-like Zn-dependent dehydrogenase
MKALVVERNLGRFAAARAASALGPGLAVARGLGPLRLLSVEAPELPGPGWQRVRPRLAGICGSDLSLLDGHASRYFDRLVSFPFVPGHEVVGTLEDGRRVVVQPALGCQARDVVPMCPACAEGRVGACERVAFGRLEPGLQTGYCASTGGGWSAELVAHESQLYAVPEDMADEEAVMVEPTACAVHAAVGAGIASGDTVVVLGAGTLGLLATVAVRHFALPGTLLVAGRYSHQRRWAAELGADEALPPDQVGRAVRRLTRSFALGRQLTGGADVVLDCVGSADSLAQALSLVRPGGRVCLVGMPGPGRLDLAPLWQREVVLTGAYAYGTEQVGGRFVRTFELAFELVASARLGRLVSARFPLERFEEAVAHAAAAGRRGSVKVVFDLGLAPERPAGGRAGVRSRRRRPSP